MAEVKLITDGAALRHLLDSASGPVGRFMIGRGEIVRLAARQDCPVRTGTLRDSIVMRYIETERGFDIRIVAAQPYAAAVHDGARPHDIPNAWGKGPDFGIGANLKEPREFFHPGNKPNPFLAKNIRLFNAF